MPKSDKRYGLGSAVRDLIKGLRGEKAPVSFPHGCWCGHPVPPLQVPGKHQCPKCKKEYVISPGGSTRRVAGGNVVVSSYDWRCPEAGMNFRIATCPKCHTHLSMYDWKLPPLDSFQGHCDWECRKCGHSEMRDGPDSVF